MARGGSRLGSCQSIAAPGLSRLPSELLRAWSAMRRAGGRLEEGADLAGDGMLCRSGTRASTSRSLGALADRERSDRTRKTLPLSSSRQKYREQTRTKPVGSERSDETDVRKKSWNN